MITEKLTSRNNPRVKAVAELVSSASARKSQSLFVAEGLRLCLDAARSGVAVRETFLTAQAMAKHSDLLGELTAASDAVFEITEEIADKISDTKTSQGIFCVCRAAQSRKLPENINLSGRYIAAEQVQNPANLGAICRTAEALGLDGMFVGGGCDLYNPKTLRASMGSVFRMQIYVCENLCAELARIKALGMRILASVPDPSAVRITDLAEKDGAVCVIGNEGNGLSDEMLALCSTRVTIPMRGRAESLNAAAAASILMWEMMRQ